MSSWSLGVVVGGGLAPDTPPPPPPQTLTRKFSKSKKLSWSLGVVGGGLVPDTPPPTTTTSNFDKKIF